jgi:hypothetical protein
VTVAMPQITQTGTTPVYQTGVFARNDEEAGYQPASSNEQSISTAK